MTAYRLYVLPSVLMDKRDEAWQPTVIDVALHGGVQLSEPRLREVASAHDTRSLERLIFWTLKALSAQVMILFRERVHPTFLTHKSNTIPRAYS